MDGERRINFLKAEAKRLATELVKIDKELIRLCGHNGFIEKINAELSAPTSNRKPRGKAKN
jgi:hypothetical protein